MLSGTSLPIAERVETASGTDVRLNRAFDNDEVLHVDDSVDPVRDLGTHSRSEP